MGSWLDNQLKKYGVTTRAVPLGQQKIDDRVLEYPPVILGRIGNDPSKKTVLVYGHYDVQPVSRDVVICFQPLSLVLVDDNCTFRQLH